MIREALEGLVNLAHLSREPKVFSVPGVNSKSFLQQGAELRQMDHEPAARDHHVHRIDDLAVWTHEKSVTWVNANAVVTTLDDDGLRRDQVTMRLLMHAEMEALHTLMTKPPAEHRNFVSFLREQLKGPLEAAAPGWLTTVRNLKVRQTTDTESNVGHGSDSFGQAIAAEAIGLKDLPEELTIRVPVWTGHPYHVNICCEFLVDTLAGTFSLKPREADLRDAEKQAIDWLTEQVEGQVQGAVCQGSP